MELLRVGSNTVPGKLAGAIANIVKNEGCAEAQCIGARAVNQLVKAVIIARSFTIPTGIDLCCVPSFETVKTFEDAEETTAIKMIIEARLDGEHK